MKQKHRFGIYLISLILFLSAAVPSDASAGTEFRPDGCDFIIGVEDFPEGGNTDDYFLFEAQEGVLHVYGDVTLRTEGVTGQRVCVEGDCRLTLSGASVSASYGPGMIIKAPYKAELILAGGTVNSFTGSAGKNINDTPGGFAGIEVEFLYEEGEFPSNVMASLTVSGEGTLNASGGPNSAGIGGSNSSGESLGRGLYGNITIDSGTVNALGDRGGAGIGSSNNPGGGTSSGSYKKTGNNTWGAITINGGTVDAESKDGAGIGGGNHVDSGTIVINGGTVRAMGAAGIGCGIGSSKNNSTGADKGPGYYWADVTIKGGDITAGSNDIGAAIGGGMYCDAVVYISGGTIRAEGGSRQGNTHHGGAGIGGGYLGHADITITGGTITATGGDGAAGIGSGGSPNSNEKRGENGRSTAPAVVRVDYTDILITGGTIDATGGEKGGAGIGLGTGGDRVSVTIIGGDITARGAKSDADSMRGGAGIGSGFYGAGTENEKYFVEADTDVTIAGGSVTAIGGWGASAIGSGADNRMAVYIEIDATDDGCDLEAYSDGTKFAIDTRNLHEDGTTTSQADDDPSSRVISGNLLQGTFVHKGEIGDIQQDPEGLSSILITNDQTDETKELTMMPESYRSYATNVSGSGVYTVYTDAEEIGRGEGRYFAVCPRENWSDEYETGNLVQYTVDEDRLSDNFYLFPVKAIVVVKEIEAAAELKNGINATLCFAISYKQDGENIFVRDSDGNILMTEIEVVSGVPMTKAYFAGVQDRTYDVWEMRADGTPMAAGDHVGIAVVKRITTRHGDDTSNNATISPEQFTDEVTVVNELTYDRPPSPPTGAQSHAVLLVCVQYLFLVICAFSVVMKKRMTD